MARHDSLRHLRRDQADGANGVVVARDRVVDQVGVAVRVHQRHDGDAHLPRLGDRDMLFADVHDEQRAGHLLHLLDAGEVAVELVDGRFQLQRLALGEPCELALFAPRLQLDEVVDSGLDGLEVGQRAAEPARGDEEGIGAPRLVDDGVLRLLLRPDHQRAPAVRRHVRHERDGVVQHPQRLLQVDDVDAVSVREDVLLHLRIPPPLLMSEMHPRLQQRLHRHRPFRRGVGVRRLRWSWRWRWSDRRRRGRPRSRCRNFRRCLNHVPSSSVGASSPRRFACRCSIAERTPETARAPHYSTPPQPPESRPRRRARPPPKRDTMRER